MHRLPRHELHHPGPGHDGQGPRLLVHHGEHAQPHGVRRASPGARRGDRPSDPGGTDGVGRHVQPALRIALFGGTTHPPGLFRPPLDQAEFPRRGRPRLFQPRRPRPGRPDAPDPGQGRHPLPGHEPLSRGFLPLGEPRRDVRPRLLARPLRKRRRHPQRPARRRGQGDPRKAREMVGLSRGARPAARVSPAQLR